MGENKPFFREDKPLNHFDNRYANVNALLNSLYELLYFNHNSDSPNSCKTGLELLAKLSKEERNELIYMLRNLSTVFYNICNYEEENKVTRATEKLINELYELEEKI